MRKEEHKNFHIEIKIHRQEKKNPSENDEKKSLLNKKEREKI